MSKVNTKVIQKPIKVTLRNTDLGIMRKFCDVIDEMGVITWDKDSNEYDSLQNRVLKELRSICNDVSWFNKDKNPFNNSLETFNQYFDVDEDVNQKEG